VNQFLFLAKIGEQKEIFQHIFLFFFLAIVFHCVSSREADKLYDHKRASKIKQSK